MTIELPRVSNEVGEAVYNISRFVARILLVEGNSEAVAYTTGERAARYAGQITLTVLKDMGIIGDDFDSESFEQKIAEMRFNLIGQTTEE